MLTKTAGYRAARRAHRAGFSLIETLLAAIILAIAVSSISGSIITSITLNRVNRDTAIAQTTARRMMETLAGEPFGTVFMRYNADTTDDALALAVDPTFDLPGGDFPVLGLDPVPGDPDGMCGQILFPTVVVGLLGPDDVALREDVVDAGLGMPRDLDGDIPDLDDHTVDYRILPVRVRVQWQSTTGPRTFDLETILTSRQ